jgi:hypothetical protein
VLGLPTRATRVGICGAAGGCSGSCVAVVMMLAMGEMS